MRILFPTDERAEFALHSYGTQGGPHFQHGTPSNLAKGCRGHLRIRLQRLQESFRRNCEIKISRQRVFRLFLNLFSKTYSLYLLLSFPLLLSLTLSLSPSLSRSLSLSLFLSLSFSISPYLSPYLSLPFYLSPSPSPSYYLPFSFSFPLTLATPFTLPNNLHLTLISIFINPCLLFITGEHPSRARELHNAVTAAIFEYAGDMMFETHRRLFAFLLAAQELTEHEVTDNIAEQTEKGRGYPKLAESLEFKTFVDGVRCVDRVENETRAERPDFLSEKVRY